MFMLPRSLTCAMEVFALGRYFFLAASFTTLLFPVPLAYADCECGYTVNATTSPDHAIFTDFLETDFTTLDDIRPDFDWKPQVWNLNPEKALGPFGRATRLETIINNPSENITQGLDGILGGHPGLNLVVPNRSYRMNGYDYLLGAELDSSRRDMFYGSFRIGYRMTKYPGTCFGFYWYHNDEQEIDIEMLGKEVGVEKSAVNLVLHTPVGGDHNNALPGTYNVLTVPYNASAAVHEFRFDWTPWAITFYHNTEHLWTISNQTLFPLDPGHIVITHWSNGNPLWSGGPPERNAALLVTYVKAYFNSSAEDRKRDHSRRCAAVGASSGRYCQIPDQRKPLKYSPPDDLPYFFTSDKIRNGTTDQIYYDPNDEKKQSSGAHLVTADIAYTRLVFAATCAMIVFGLPSPERLVRLFSFTSFWDLMFKVGS